MALINLKNITKIYGQGDIAVTAVNDVCLDVEPKQMLAVMGPSGSGKTTLLSIMGCILKPSSGRLTLLGEDVTDLDENQLPMIRRKHIGFVFQAFNLLSSLTALENIVIALNYKGIRGEKAVIMAKELLSKVNLTHRMNFLPEKLSGGEKQRVSIARALTAGPKLILADEPTGNLDAKAGEEVARLLKDLAHRGNCAVVVVTHDSRIKPFCDKTLYLEDGRIKTGGREGNSKP